MMATGPMRHNLPAVAAGVLLALIALYGIYVAACMTYAQNIYFNVKYGRFKDQPGAVLAECERGYPYDTSNYHQAILAAETAYYQRFDVRGAEMPARVLAADRWCDRGLAMNFRQSQLRLLKARLIERHAPADAAAYWRKYVEWSFWMPEFHAELAGLYAAAGNYDAALDSLAWTKGSEHYLPTRHKILTIWRRESQLPTLPGMPIKPSAP